MIPIEAAREFDEQDIPLAAAWAFEVARTDGTLEWRDYANLAFIYANAGDFGYAAAHRLPQSFVQLSSARMSSALAEGLSRFQGSPLVFWQRFLFHLEAGCDGTSMGEPFPPSCKQLVDGLWRFAFLNDETFAHEAELLLRDSRASRSSLDRYVESVLGHRLSTGEPSRSESRPGA